MVKKVEGALYKMTSKDRRLPKGTIVRLTDDDGTNIPFFKAEGGDICLYMNTDVKLLKPKKGDTVRLYRFKHTRRDMSDLGYYPEDGMLKKGGQGVVIRADKSDESIQVEHEDGQIWWYYAKDFAVIEREGVSF